MFITYSTTIQFHGPSTHLCSFFYPSLSCSRTLPPVVVWNSLTFHAANLAHYSYINFFLKICYSHWRLLFRNFKFSYSSSSHPPGPLCSSNSHPLCSSSSHPLCSSSSHPLCSSSSHPLLVFICLPPLLEFLFLLKIFKTWLYKTDLIMQIGQTSIIYYT